MSQERMDHYLSETWQERTGVDPRNALAMEGLSILELLREIVTTFLGNCLNKLRRKGNIPPEPPEESRAIKHNINLIQGNLKMKRRLQWSVFNEIKQKNGEAVARRTWRDTVESMLASGDRCTVEELAEEIADEPSDDDLPWDID